MPDSLGLAQYAPNLCTCGHDYQAHVTGGSCTLCNNVHNHTAGDILPGPGSNNIRISSVIPGYYNQSSRPYKAAVATINNTGGYPIGTITMTVTLVNGSFQVNDVVLIDVGSVQEILIVKTVNSPTSVTFSPGAGTLSAHANGTSMFVLGTYAAGSCGAAQSANNQRGG